MADSKRIKFKGKLYKSVPEKDEYTCDGCSMKEDPECYADIANEDPCTRIIWKLVTITDILSGL